MVGKENDRFIGPLLLMGGQDSGPFFFHLVLLQCPLLKSVEIGFYIIVWGEIAKQFLCFLSWVKEAWEGSPLHGLVMQQFLCSYLEAVSQFLCHLLLMTGFQEVLDKGLHVGKGCGWNLCSRPHSPPL